MGLEQFNIAPDNKGGRKKKSEKETKRDKTRAGGEAYAPDNDTEEWWKEQLAHDDVESSGDTIPEKIQALSGHVFMHPIRVRIKLEEHGIHETDWDEYVDEYPMYEDDLRIRRHLGIYSGGSSTSSFLSGSSSSGSSSYSSDSGLASIVNDAK